MKLTEIAEKIDAHLRRFEADPTINVPRKMGRDPVYYYQAYAWQAGRYVAVKYVAYQGQSTLSRAEAEQYLAWLDAGNVGKHWRVNA